MPTPSIALAINGMRAVRHNSGKISPAAISRPVVNNQ
jgi:hypothetical protein